MSFAQIMTLIQLLVPIAIQVAQTVHPQPGKGSSRMETAASFVTGAVSEAGGPLIDNTTVKQEIQKAVDHATEVHGDVPKLPEGK